VTYRCWVREGERTRTVSSGEREDTTNPVAGPKRIGIRPGRPLVHRLPVELGENVLRVDGLPPRLTVDRTSRVISGITNAVGSHVVTIHGVGTGIQWTDTLEIVVGGDICLTPPLGWNSWNVFGSAVTEDDIRRSAISLIDTGLVERGWSTVNIDDGWQGGRDRRGRLQPNDKFRDLAVLCDDLHSLGLRVGIYSSPGPTTCAGFAGSAGHEAEDAASFASWGFDYLKYDWCSAGPIGDETPIENLVAPFARMRDALDRVDRDIVYHVCQYGFGKVWEWAADRVGANAWRTTGDIDDTWDSVDRIGFAQANLAHYARPGRWNDPDMLVVGSVGGAWDRPIRPTRLTGDEQRTHLGLWAILAAPLLLGCDLSLLDAATLELVADREVLAINQDQLGRQAERIRSDDGLEIWRKPMADGSSAVGVFNRGTSSANASVEWRQLGLAPTSVRDVWAHRSVDAADGWGAVIPSHGSVLLRTW
jgi:alpha-galactosidase